MTEQEIIDFLDCYSEIIQTTSEKLNMLESTTELIQQHLEVDEIENMHCIWSLKLVKEQLVDSANTLDLIDSNFRKKIHQLSEILVNKDKTK